MTSTTTSAKINLFDLFDGAELTETQRERAYGIYDLTRQLNSKLDEMTNDIERSKRQLSEAVRQFMPAVINPQVLVDVAILNTQLAAAHEAAMREGVSNDVRIAVTTAAVQK